MTDQEKHEFCRKRTGFCATFLPASMYAAAERGGVDMRWYVKQQMIPLTEAPAKMSTGAVVTIFDRPRRSCSGCFHWASYKKKNEDGYVEALCQRDSDDRDHKWKRASDYCSKWKKVVTA